MVHLISLGTSLCLALRALLCNVQFSFPAKLSSQARYSGRSLSASMPSVTLVHPWTSSLPFAVWVDQLTSPRLQILIDPSDLEYTEIHCVALLLDIPILISLLRYYCKTPLKLGKPYDIWIRNIRAL